MSMRRAFRAGVVSALLGATVAVVGAVDSAPPAAAITLPSGFTDLVVAQVPAAIAVAAAPGGQILVSSKTGQLTLVRNGIKQPNPALDLSGVTCTQSERGLLGIAVDPGFAADGSGGFVYLYYTHDDAGTCLNRVSRFVMTNGVIAPASEVVLLDDIPSVAGNHNGGDLEFDLTGHLLVSVGDSACNPREITQCSGTNQAAQDLGLLNGKILRINTDGTPAAGNPFSGAGTARCDTTGSAPAGTECQEVWASGFRNPFRIAVNPNPSGPRLYVNDVGLVTWEEVDDVVGGGNYGWNTYEGPCVTGSTTNCPAAFPAGVSGPVTAYQHDSSGCVVITGGAFVPNGAWPAQYQGGYLFSDESCGKVWFLAAGATTAAPFATLGVGGAISMRFAEEPGGWSLYYTNINGQLHRIVAASQTVPTGPSRFVPVTPTRVLDTRLGVGGSTGKLVAGTAIGLQVTGSVVPSGAIAAAINITMAEPAAAGFLKVWPSRTPEPDVSNVNASISGETVANASVVALPSDGQLTLLSSTDTHVIVDVAGYWVPAASAGAGRFVTADSPQRLFDTRFGLNAPQSKVGPGPGLVVTVLGHGGVPSTGVSAVALTLTADAAAGQGFVTAFPAGTIEPNVSNLNPQRAGDVRANLVIVPVPAGGQIAFTSSTSVNLLADVVGWFTDSAAAVSADGLFFPIAPTRLADTRFGNPTTRPSAGAVTTLPFGSPVPSSASAVAYNLTGAQSAGAGFLEAFPAGVARPDTSTVNFAAPGQDRAAFALTRRSGTGVSFYSSVAADEIVDVAGYFS
jgi:glucose/arabinose dehydrogenase